MNGRRRDFREVKPAEAVAVVVARLAELSAQIAHLHDSSARLRAEIASHFQRLDHERERANQLASGVVPARQDEVTETSSTDRGASK